MLNYIKVDFTPVVHLRSSYPSGRPSWSEVRQHEFDHVADDRWWARNTGEPLVARYERTHLGDRFNNKTTCENNLEAGVESQLANSYDAASRRSGHDWDSYWNGRRPHPPHIYDPYDGGWGPRPGRQK